jgi:hypothetical protein
VSSRLLNVFFQYLIEFVFYSTFRKQYLLQDIRTYVLGSGLIGRGSLSFLESALNRHPPLDDCEVDFLK